MSGIAGIVNLDGAPIDRDLLRRLTDALAFRGPDAQHVDIHNNIGFGHTLLHTTHESETEKQPLTLDRKVWVTGDIRLDGRAELISKLGKKFSTPPNDAELLLHAYETWQEDCVKHLLGDFAFAIWDSTRQRLFCARDQLGVRQFYYSYTKDRFVFSNTLNCLRLDPQVTRNLNEVAVGDFLVFGLNQDPSTTIFSDIKRLPKAHAIVVSRDGIRSTEYWTPTTTPVHHADYIARFNELLGAAVADRLRTTRAGVSMSGGLDSSAIAATARRHDPALDLNAYCVVYDSEFHDEERKYATTVADALGIPLEFLHGNEINQQAASQTWPEPFDVDPIYVVSIELLRRVSARARVMLTGWDGDTFLNETPRHSFAQSLKSGNLPRLLLDLTRFVYFQHGPPPIGIRTQWRRWRNPYWNRPPFPVWLNDDFARRFNLNDRWRELSTAATTHPLRPRVFSTLFSPHWDSLMSRHDAGTTLLPLEVRHPLIDVRVVEYLLGLPVIPWLLDKAILRRAMAGILPDAVRLRPKSPLGGDPGLLLRHTRKFQEIDDFKPVSTICSYVDRKSIPRVTDEVNSSQLSINVRPYCLNQWLAYSHS